jgi:hypothetical protein
MFDDLILWPYRVAGEKFGFWVLLAWFAIAADIAIVLGLFVLGWPAMWLLGFGVLRCAPWLLGAIFVLTYSWRRRHPHVS